MIPKDEIFFTAITAANDIMALGAIKALQERNIRVPEDISIILLPVSMNIRKYQCHQKTTSAYE